jgi:LCP family protein required for cell wall assembly
MNARRFYFVLTIIISAVLFLSGSGILYYINNHISPVTQDVFASAGGTSNSTVNDIIQPLIQSKEPFNVLLLGGDKVSNSSDTMMLANFDPATYKINIMSIPRDTRVFIKGKERKINYAYASGGVDLAVQTVQELMDVKIKYYVFVDLSAFRKIIDILGGVDYYVPANLDYDDPTQNLHIHLKKGQQTLNGAQAEQYVRFRKPNKWTKELRQYYDGSDLKRNEAQQNFMRELMRQKLTLQYLPKLNSVIETVFENVKTNFTLNEVVKMTGYISRFSVENVNFIPMPGTTYDVSPWYYICDVPATRQVMAESFKCDDSFMSVDSDAKAFYLTKEAKYSPPKPEVKAEALENPSNGDTAITGSELDP